MKFFLPSGNVSLLFLFLSFVILPHFPISLLSFPFSLSFSNASDSRSLTPFFQRKSYSYLPVWFQEVTYHNDCTLTHCRSGISFDRTLLPVLIALGFSKVFDTVNHELLLAKLECYGLSYSALLLIPLLLTWLHSKSSNQSSSYFFVFLSCIFRCTLRIYTRPTTF